jgi:hypothetical protein
LDARGGRFLTGTSRIIRAFAGEHRDRLDPVIERQDQMLLFDLTDCPTADVVANPHPHNLGRRARADNRSRFIAIHDNAEERDVGRRRWWRRWLWRMNDWRRWRWRTTRRREQRTLARRRQTLQRLTCQRTSERGIRLTISLPCCISRDNRHRRQYQ